MSPNRGDSGPAMESPALAPEHLSESSEKKAEVAAHAEALPGKTAAAPQAPALPVVIPDANPVNLPLPQDDATITTGVSVARKKDEGIEKEWVQRAKSIIDKTKDDPFKQKSEVSKVKAEYIKHRFNKIIQTDPGK